MSTLRQKLSSTIPLRPLSRKARKRHGMPSNLPPAIAGKLRALASRVLRVSWVEGLLWVLAALSLLILVQGALDWVFDLSRGVRALFLLADLAILGVLVFRFGIQAWRYRLTPEEAALQAERHWPHLRTGLISAVQLARQPDGSPIIVNAMLTRMAGRMANFDLRQAVEWKRLKKLLFLTIVLLIACAGLITWLTPKSLILLQRMVLRNVPLPTETIVVPLSKNFSVANGENIELSAQASGVIPRSGRVEVTYEGRPPEMVTISPKGSSPDIFSLPLANVQQPLTYRFYLNDGRGEEWRVELIHPPVLTEIQFESENPSYTGLPATKPLPGGLSLLAGSKLKISGQSSQPLNAARLVVAEDKPPLEMKPEGSGRTGFHTTLDIPKEGLDGFWIELTNNRGTVSQNNTVYAVEILPDKNPEIVFAEGQPDKANLVAERKPRLRFEVRDDFQVQEVFLCIQAANSLGEGEEPDPANAKQIPIAMPSPGARIAFDYEWSDPEKSVDWAEGQTFTYWIKAVDNNDVTGPGITYSSPRQWSVVSLQTKREELAEQLRKHAESIEDLSGAQESVRKELGEWLKHDSK